MSPYQCVECGETATKEREVEGVIVHLCAEHAREFDEGRRPRVVIAYQIEQTDGGWVVWRRVGDLAAEAADGRPYHSRREASEAVESQKRSDRAAATRLGVKLEHK